MIKTYRELLDISKEFNELEKINFIYNYFLYNVQYDYDLQYTGFIMPGMDKTDNIRKKIQYKNDDGSTIDMVLNKKIYSKLNYKSKCGGTDFFQKILELQDKYDLAKLDELKNEILSVFRKEYYDFVKNKDYLDKAIIKFCSEVLDKSYIPYKQIDQKTNLYNSYDIANMIIKSYADNGYKLRENGKVVNGLLTKGVCRHFSHFLSKYLTDNNIENTEVMGISKLPHVWNMIKIGDEIKFIDISSEIHIRDNTCYSNLNLGDFYLVSIDKLFELDPNRVIIGIGTHAFLPRDYISKDNYQTKKSRMILEKAFEKKEEAKILIKK